ncbi:MAG: molybdenum cofactor guanylyltransferase [Chthoniobacterales bacterium]|jgi:molybdopterin-guanine dinucleotide biosynthesis protein A|nr:molybdenum cofactor guanylyltransferase [Chthoniobacterales bacterium]
MRFSAVLLAGGKSTRMGRDKALLEIEGEPLWRRQLATLRRLSPERMIISGPPRDGCIAVEDEIEGAGPLAGVAVALQKCTSPLLVVLAVDLPRMTTDFLQSLLALCRDGKGAVPRGPGFFEPLAAVYPAACAGLAAAALHSADFSMASFVRAAMEQKLLVSRTILPSEVSLFTNLNTPADL